MTTTELPDEVLDAVGWSLTDTAKSPSQIARKAKTSTSQAAAALRWLAANQMAVTEGNGAWTKYRSRRFGEYR